MFVNSSVHLTNQSCRLLPLGLEGLDKCTNGFIRASDSWDGCKLVKSVYGG